jgi:hypothetical protein
VGQIKLTKKRNNLVSVVQLGLLVNELTNSLLGGSLGQKFNVLRLDGSLFLTRVSYRLKKGISNVQQSFPQ